LEKIVNEIKKQESAISQSNLVTHMDEFEKEKFGTLYKYS
jgi:hypothetical protein